MTPFFAVILPSYFAILLPCAVQSASKESFIVERHETRSETSFSPSAMRERRTARPTDDSNSAIGNLKLAAFNVQTFGVKKMSTKGVPEILVKIILRYDVILIQEIRDSSGKAIMELLSMVNRNSTRGQYDISISPRLGRSTSKEEYAFLYRKDLLSVKAAYVYDDGDESTNNDTFEREPYIVHFNSIFTDLTDFVLVAIHTSPSKAPQEIHELTSVYDDVIERLNIKDVVILGDLNAACSYMSDKDWSQVSLATDKRFHWLISDCVDTTVAGGHCAYDRFVAAGDAMLKAVVDSSAGSFEYDHEYGVNKSMASLVSDHFPIEIQLFSKGLASAKSMIQKTVEYSFKSKKRSSISRYNIWKLRRIKPLQQAGFSATVTYTSTRAIGVVTLAKKFQNVDEAVDYITVLRNETASLQIFTDDEAQMAALQVTGAWRRMQVPKSGVVKLVCELYPPACWIALSLD